MNGAQCTTVEVVLGTGIEGLLRVVSILAHQRTSLRSLSMGADPALAGMQLLRLCVEGPPDLTQQLVKRLRRAPPVQRVTASALSECPD